MKTNDVIWDVLFENNHLFSDLPNSVLAGSMMPSYVTLKHYSLFFLTYFKLAIQRNYRPPLAGRKTKCLTNLWAGSPSFWHSFLCLGRAAHGKDNEGSDTWPRQKQSQAAKTHPCVHFSTPWQYLPCPRYPSPTPLFSSGLAPCSLLGLALTGYGSCVFLVAGAPSIVTSSTSKITTPSQCKE